MGEDVRGISAADQQTILFVDLRGFSQWALRAEDTDVAELLRGVDAAVTEVVEARAGVVVKRLGDGAMAVFAECDSAVEAAFAGDRRRSVTIRVERIPAEASGRASIAVALIGSGRTTSAWT